MVFQFIKKKLKRVYAAIYTDRKIRNESFFRQALYFICENKSELGLQLAPDTILTICCNA